MSTLALVGPALNVSRGGVDRVVSLMDIFRFLLVTLTGAVVLAPAGTEAQTVDSTALNNAAMEWVTLLRDQHFDSAAARVDPAAAAQLGATQLEGIWHSVGAQLGPMESLAEGPVTEARGYHVVDLKGTFANGTFTVRVTFDAHTRVSGLFFLPRAEAAWTPPAYADQAAFREVEVTVGHAPWQLPGTLALPVGEGPFPAVVLVHGSGPNDRNESIGPNRPFQDLAWGLATRGIAVLRYEKRTKVYGARMSADIGLDEEVIDDAVAALALARSRPEIDPRRVVVVGHSLGAMLAPEIARRDGRVAGIVMLAAPARRFTEVLRGQLEYGASLTPSDAAARAATDSILALIDAYEAGELPDTVAILGARRPYLAALDALDPAATLLGIPVPLFLLQGGRDYQSTMADFALWQKRLSRRKETLLRAYPDLDHLFAPGEGMATPTEYMTVPNHVAKQVVDDLADWIKALAPRSPS
jgi:pimeloyl-ACP methyl ester carboxylesterase